VSNLAQIQKAGLQISGSLTIAANGDFSASVTFEIGGGAIDLTGIAFGMQLRDSTGQNLWLALSGAQISGAASGVLSISIPASQTKLLKEYGGQTGQADILAVADGVVYPLCQAGPLSVTINEGVTWG
jgi:hypothetical protein